MADVDDKANVRATETPAATRVATPSDDPASNVAEEQPLSFWQMLSSTLWAALGVQNNKNRQRDFSRGKATHFIFFGIGFTVFFVLAVYAVVSLVLSGAD